MIPFNKPYICGNESVYIEKAFQSGQLSGDGEFTKSCSQWLESTTGAAKVLLTHSCTAALEIAALMLNIKLGDEIIMPSYTFVSTANAFALRGGVPVFVDIRVDTLNIDETLIESAITERTKAIVVVHYAGVPCEMDVILEIAKRYGLRVIEDAAQGLLSSYKGRQLGSLGDLGCYSFHETKNIHSGEGGSLIINDESLIERAEIIREKGTNRSRFFRGELNKYTWTDIGSSYLPSEITAAFLFAQLEEARKITTRRLELWNFYHQAFKSLENDNYVVRPKQQGNGHIYYLILSSRSARDRFIMAMREARISCVFHYIPLHTSPMAIKMGAKFGDLCMTEQISERLVRLPLWIGLETFQDYIIQEATVSVRQG